MATSGTVSTTLFNNVKVIETAFRYCRVSPQKVTAENLQVARDQLHLMLSSWVNKKIPLWTIEITDIPIVQGVAEVVMPTGTLNILNLNLKTGGQEIPLAPISLDTYANLPNKMSQGRPTIYWFNRQLTPVVTLWPAPDAAAASSVLRAYRTRHIMDVGSFQNDIEVPQRWFDALCAGLAFKLACSIETIDPQMMTVTQGIATQLFNEAAAEEQDSSPMMIAPDIGMYTA